MYYTGHGDVVVEKAGGIPQNYDVGLLGYPRRPTGDWVWIADPRHHRERTAVRRSKTPTMRPKQRAKSRQRKRGLPRGRTWPSVRDAYLRAPPQETQEIFPRHDELAASFGSWLETRGYSDVRWEKGRVDVEFAYAGQLCRAEIKICGRVTTHSIREALGQLLEYNHYGTRQPAKGWFVILDQLPTDDDKHYVRRLRTKVGLPVYLGWQDGQDFKIDGWKV
jgi:hypothetical protein